MTLRHLVSANLRTGLRRSASPGPARSAARRSMCTSTSRSATAPSTKRHLDAGDVAIVVVIDSGDEPADRRIRVAHQPHEQAGLDVEAQRHHSRRLRRVPWMTRTSRSSIEQRGHATAPPCQHLLDARREKAPRLRAWTPSSSCPVMRHQRHGLVRRRRRDPPVAAVESWSRYRRKRRGRSSSAGPARARTSPSGPCPHRQSRCTCPWRVKLVRAATRCAPPIAAMNLSST